MTDRDPGLEGWPDPQKPPRPKTTMTEWQKFALLIFAIVAVVVVWMNINGGISRML
jgi:hypothetical protein